MLKLVFVPVNVCFQSVKQTLDQAQDKLKHHQQEIKSTEKQVKDHRAKAETVRSVA